MAKKRAGALHKQLKKKNGLAPNQEALISDEKIFLRRLKQMLSISFPTKTDTFQILFALFFAFLHFFPFLGLKTPKIPPEKRYVRSVKHPPKPHVYHRILGAILPSILPYFTAPDEKYLKVGDSYTYTEKKFIVLLAPNKIGPDLPDSDVYKKTQVEPKNSYFLEKINPLGIFPY